MVGVSFLRPFGSPGTTTTDSAERIGIRPVLNDARPAVQLAWPYQLVKSAPSLASLSRLGVGCPSARPPPVYAPRSSHPVSSLMRTRMLGFFAACASTDVASANPIHRPSHRNRVPLMVLTLLVPGPLVSLNSASARAPPA